MLNDTLNDDKINLLNFNVNDALSILPIYRHLKESQLVVSDLTRNCDLEETKEFFNNNECEYVQKTGFDSNYLLTTKSYDFLLDKDLKKNNISIRLIDNFDTSYLTYSHKSNIGFKAVLVPGFYSHHLVSANTVAIPIGLPKFDDFFNNKYSRDDILKVLPIDKNKPVLVFIHNWPEGHTLFRYWKVLIQLRNDFNIIIKPLYKESKKFNIFQLQKNYSLNFDKLIKDNNLIGVDNHLDYIKLFKVADLVLTDANSDVYLESCLCANTPTIGLITNIKSDCALLQNKYQELSIINKKPENLIGDIDFALTQKESFDENRLKWKDKLLKSCEGKSGKLAADIVHELIDENKKVRNNKNIIKNTKKKRNIIWICIDGLRPDKLHSCGNNKAPKLFIDELLLKGVLFSKVFSASSTTGTAMISVFSSLFFSNIGKVNDQNILYITDFFKHYGYSTLIYNDLFASPPVPFSGFNYFQCSKYQVGYIDTSTGGKFTFDEQKKFIKQFNNIDGPKFAYIHLDILHEFTLGNVCSSQKYEESIVKTSKHFENLFGNFRISQEDIIIISTDHGIVLDCDYQAKDKELGSRHEEIQSQTFCSFIIPGIIPKKIDNLIRAIDIVPTILDIADFDDKVGLGRSLLPIILGEKYRPIWAFREFGFSFDTPQYNLNNYTNNWAVRTERYKYVKHLWRKDSNWLIDLEKHKDYRKNLIGQGLEIEQIFDEIISSNLIENPLSPEFIYKINKLEFSKKEIIPEISIIIPVQKHVTDLHRFIYSLCLNTLAYTEILVIDSEKTFQTQFLLQHYSGHPNLFYHRYENSSFCELLNKGIEHVRGKFTFFALPESQYPYTYLHRLKETIEKGNSNTIAVSDYCLINNKNDKKHYLATIPNAINSISSSYQCFCSLFLTENLKKAGRIDKNNFFHEFRKKVLQFGNEIVLSGFSTVLKEQDESIFNKRTLNNKETNNPKVSIILPVYDDYMYFNRTISCLLAQSYKDFEIIIVENGRNNEILNQVKETIDKRICFISYESYNLSDLINEGIRHSKGDYITWIYSYSLFDPEYINDFINVLDKNNDIDFVYSDYAWLNENDKVVEVVNILSCYREYLVKYVPNYSFMYRKSMHITAGFFNNRLEGVEDWDMFLRLHENSTSFHISKINCYRFYNIKNMQQKQKNIKNLSSFFIDMNIRLRYNFVLNIYKLYPFITTCKDKEYSTFIAYFDIGCAFFLANQFLLATNCFNIAESMCQKGYLESSLLKINMSLTYIKLKRWDDAVKIAYKLKNDEDERVQKLSNEVIKSYRTDRQFNFPGKIIMLDKKEYELFQLEVEYY